MDQSVGMNGPIMALTFLSGMGALSVGGVVSSIGIALLVGMIGKGMDALLRYLIAQRTNAWRRRARRLEQENRELQALLQTERTTPPPPLPPSPDENPSGRF